MSDPSVEQGGWAADGPGSGVRRGRSPLLGALALVLLAGGIAASVIGIVRVADDAGPSDDRILTRGTITPLDSTQQLISSFEASEPGEVTVWLALGGPANVRESIVAGTTCELYRVPGPPAEEIAGRVQGTVVATDEHETIGEGTVGRGQNQISCHHVPFGPVAARGALAEEHEFVVERGTPGDGLDGWWLIIPGIPAALLGLALLVRWRAGRVRSV